MMTAKNKPLAHLRIGLALDATVCAYCGLKVADHNQKMAAFCRAGLNAREVAAEAAVKQEAEIAAAKKSPQEQLDDLEEELSSIEDKRKELLLEIATEEVLEKILDGDIEKEDEKKLHANCRTEDDVESAREEAQGLENEAWDYLREFGSHSAACLSGALVGSQAPHPLCTCGWNTVATDLERRPQY